MKKAFKLLIPTMLILLVTKSNVQSSGNKVGIGLNINQYQKDFGIGVHLISPYVLNSTIALRVGANLQWLDHINGSKTTWTAYQNIQLGLRRRHYILENKLNIYGEGGLVTLLPNTDFSSNSSVFGGYGLFGFEFKPQRNFAFLFEMGGIGTGAVADKVWWKPIYSNGFLSSVGFRIEI